MTADPPGSSAPPLQPEAKPSIAVPLIVWLLIQLAAVALAASGLPLSANFSRPPQSLAVHQMLVAQFVGSAMFLPLLFGGRSRGWRAWLGIVLTAGPMLMLAAWLARMPMSRVPMLWGCVAAWVTMLALWGAVARACAKAKSRGLQSLGFPNVVHALAMLLSAGELLLWYAHAEFQPARDPLLVRLSPLPSALRNAAGADLDLSPLLSTAALSAAAVVILAAKASRRRKSAH